MVDYVITIALLIGIIINITAILAFLFLCLAIPAILAMPLLEKLKPKPEHIETPEEEVFWKAISEQAKKNRKNPTTYS
jgi:hypothetical protein